MEKTAYDIILAPVVTEKSMAAMAAQRKYTFKVRRNANKFEIRKALEELFGIKITKVATMHVRGAYRVTGRNGGYKPNWKKAIVTISEDSKAIEFFDSMM